MCIIKAMDAAKSRKMEKIGRILDIVLNVVFVPILILVAIFSLSIMITRVTNGVPSVFGYTQIQIISGSMQDAGFKIGETYYVKSQDPATLQVGDYIAFFQDYDPNCSSPSMVTPSNRPAQKASDARILFHEIVAIEIDLNGERWFTTQGTNNENPDSVKIYQNYVIGKWAEEETFWTSLISFVTSPIGIVCLSVVPCSLIIAVDLYQLIILCYTYQQLKKQSAVIATPRIDEKKADKENMATNTSIDQSFQHNSAKRKSLQSSESKTANLSQTESLAKPNIPPSPPKRNSVSTPSAKIKVPPPPPKRTTKDEKREK